MVTSWECHYIRVADMPLSKYHCSTNFRFVPNHLPISHYGQETLITKCSCFAHIGLHTKTLSSTSISWRHSTSYEKRDVSTYRTYTFEKLFAHSYCLWSEIKWNSWCTWEKYHSVHFPHSRVLKNHHWKTPTFVPNHQPVSRKLPKPLITNCSSLASISL